MQAVVDDLMTHYSRSGKGKTVLLLHGWGDNLQTFSELQDRLRIGYDVIALDLPGFGRTDAPQQSWGLDNYAQFVASFLGKINATPFAIVGHSNGGAISVRALGTKVLSAKKLILLASSGVRGEYEGRNLLLRLVTKTGKALVTPLPLKIKRRLRKQLYKTVGSDLLVAEHLQETFKKVVTDDVRQDAQNITIPTLLIYGDKDQATPMKYAHMFNERFKNAKLVSLPEAGHFIHHQNAAEVNRTVLEFLDAK